MRTQTLTYVTLLDVALLVSLLLVSAVAPDTFVIIVRISAEVVLASVGEVCECLEVNVRLLF